MKTEVTTTTTPSPTQTSKVIGYICAEGHGRITYYSPDGCPLCKALGVVAVLTDRLSIAEYDYETLRQSLEDR